VLFIPKGESVASEAGGDRGEREEEEEEEKSLPSRARKR